MIAAVRCERIGIVVHHGKPASAGVVERLAAWAARRGAHTVELDVWGDLDTGDTPSTRRHAKAEAEAAGRLDLIVTIGGDGTFLRGLRVAAAADAPVLGCNLGRVGFLTEVDADHLVDALDAFADDHAIIEERLTLTMRANRALEVPAELDVLLRYGHGPALPPPAARPGLPEEVGWGVALDVTALNDVVFEKLARDRQASLAVYVANRLFVSYSADALIIATPTGSTAYSFAANGPVVSPRAEALIFTPVAAHMAFNRSLVVAADESIAIRVLEHSGRVALSVDGQIRGVLEPGDWVGVYARPWRARLVRISEPDFFGRVRDRFHLADAAAAAADGAPPRIYRPDAPVPAELAHLNIPAPE